MILNETPIRTAKNFGINNIEIKNLEELKKIEDFEGVTISGDTSDFEISRKFQKNTISLWG